MLAKARIREWSQRPAFQGGGWRVLSFSCLLNALMFGLFFVVATPGYETNDDLTMQLIASGFYAGQPSEYLVFTHFLLGWMLRLLYELTNATNWYFIYLVSCHILSFTAISFVVLGRKRNWATVLLLSGFFLLVEPRILLNLQFTTTAFLTGAAGLLLLVDGLEGGHPPCWSKVSSGIAMITLMGMIREPVLPLLVIIAFPFLIERFGLQGWRRAMGAALACGASFLLLHGINCWYYERDPAWAEYIEYNELRGRVHGTALVQFLASAAPVAGWSTNDAAMFKDFYFPEATVYADTAKLRRVVGRLEGEVRTQFKFSDFSVARLWLPIVLQRDPSVLSSLALLNALWCWFALGAGRFRCLIAFVVTYAVAVVIAFCLWETSRLPTRVSYNLPLFLNLICLYSATGLARTHSASSPGNNVVRPFSFLQRPCTVIWMALYLYFLSELGQNLWYTNARNHNLKQISRRVFNPIQSLSRDGVAPLLIPMPSNSVLEQCLQYRHPGEDPPFSVVPYGWLTHSPIFRKVLAQQRLEPFSLSLVDRPHAFFLMEKRWLEPLRTFYLEHYGLDIWFETVLNTDGESKYRDCRLVLYQVHSRSKEKSSKRTSH